VLSTNVQWLKFLVFFYNFLGKYVQIFVKKKLSLFSHIFTFEYDYIIHFDRYVKWIKVLV